MHGFGVTLDLRSLLVLCNLRVAPGMGVNVSWFLLSHLIPVVSLRFASERVEQRTGAGHVMVLLAAAGALDLRI